MLEDCTTITNKGRVPVAVIFRVVDFTPPGPSVKSSVFAEKVNPSANESLCRCTFGGGFYSINHNGGGFSKINIFWGRIEKRQKNGGGFLRMEADRSCVTCDELTGHYHSVPHHRFGEGADCRMEADCRGGL
jgi:hypothetical protein